MKGNHKQIVSTLLMIASMTFLAGFLILFLFKSYSKERENLQKEVGYLFVNSVRQIEGGVLNNLVYLNDSVPIKRMRFPKLKRDSLKVKSVFKIVGDQTLENERVTNNSGNKMEIELRHDAKFNDINQLEGSVAMFISLSRDSLKLNDSCILGNVAIDFLSELESDFHKNMVASNLPITYSIHKESDHSSHINSNSVSGSYTDISNGDRYLVHIDDYGFTIYKKILPELVLSSLLFICVALAFYMIHRTLASERKLLILKNDFIQNVTHELKTPIATVGVALEALQDFKVMDDVHKRDEYFNISKIELKRLTLLVDKVLNISQLDNELPAQQLEKLDLHQVILEILDTLKLQLDNLNVKVHVEKQGDDFKIFADRHRVDGLLYNLIDNAMKYNNSIEPKIDIQLLSKNQQVCLIIADNGIGIPSEHQNNVFEKFYRIPQGNVHNVKGHGLGLSFVMQVVNELNGTISLKSKAGEGSEFIIHFPLYSKAQGDI